METISGGRQNENVSVHLIDLRILVLRKNLGVDLASTSIEYPDEYFICFLISITFGKNV